jgi:integrase
VAGSIEQRGKDSWRISLSAGFDPKTGKRQWIRRTIRGDRTDAERALMRLTLEVGDELPDALSLSTTVTQLLDAWLPVAKLAATTRYDYRLCIDKHIRPSKIGSTPIHKVTALGLDKLYAALERDGLGPDRIRRVHTILRSAFKQAIKWQMIARNPVPDASPPPVPDREIEAPEPHEYRRLVTKAAGDRGQLLLSAVAVHLGATIGSRRGEICGLQWPDIDFDDETITVRRAVAVVPGVGDVVKELKEKRRRSRIPIDAGTIDLLWLWNMETSELRAQGINPHGWLLLAPKTLSFYRPDRLSRLFRRLADDAGLPGVHFHSLRHYMIRQLLDAGVEVGVASRRAGHARTSTTHDMYGGPVGESARAAADVIARINRGD